MLQAIGDVQNFRGARDAALASYTEALTLFRAVGARLGEANVFLSLGEMALGVDDEEHGVEYLEQATRLYEAIGARSGLANVRITLARLAASKGEFQKAIDYMQPAADFGRRIRHPLGDQLQAQIDQWRQQLVGGTGVSQEDAAQQAFAQFLADVVAGARGDDQRGQRAYEQARALQGEDAPTELQAIGRACQRLLEGLRGDDVLRDLPEEVKPLVVQLLEQIEG